MLENKPERMTIARATAMATAVCLVTGGVAATDPILDRLRAQKVSDSVLFTLAPGSKTVSYRLEAGRNGGNDTSHAVNAQGPAINLAATQGTVNIYFSYLNPLTYSIALSSEDKPDPNDGALDAFLEALKDLLGLVTPAATASPRVDDDQPFAPALVELWMWKHYVERSDPSCVLDDNLTGAIVSSQSQIWGNAWERSLHENVESLRRANTLVALEHAVQGASPPSELARMLKRYRSDLDSFERLEGETLRMPSTASPVCQAFVRFVASTLTRYVKDGRAILAARENALNTYQPIVERASRMTDPTTRVGDAFKVGEVSNDPGRYKFVTVTITRTELDDALVVKSITRDATVRMNVARYTKTAEEFAAGILFTDLTFPKFATESRNGRTVVAAGSESVHTVPSAMLNVVFRSWLGSAVRPMLQVGAGVGGVSVRPVLFLGGGLRFVGTPRLSISVGGLWHWVRVLHGLQVGDAVSGTAELEQAMTYSFDSTPRPYVGVQYNF